MNKIRLGPNYRAIASPLPTVLFGSQVEGNPNYSVVANFGVLSIGNPCPIIYVSSVATHYTNKGVREHGTFSVSIPSVAMMTETDYCGIISGSDVDKSKVFESFYGTLETAPMIVECPVNLECELIQTLPINKMEVFVGKVVDTYADEGCLTGEYPDMAKVDPLVYAMGSRYWKLGEKVGRAFWAGRNHKDYSTKQKIEFVAKKVVGKVSGLLKR